MRFRASPEEMEQRHKSREIDRLLEKDKHTFRRQVNWILTHSECVLCATNVFVAKSNDVVFRRRRRL